VVLAITDYGCWYTQTGRVTPELLIVITTCCNNKTSAKHPHETEPNAVSANSYSQGPLLPRSTIAKVHLSEGYGLGLELGLVLVFVLGLLLGFGYKGP